MLKQKNFFETEPYTPYGNSQFNAIAHEITNQDRNSIENYQFNHHQNSQSSISIPNSPESRSQQKNLNEEEDQVDLQDSSDDESDDQIDKNKKQKINILSNSEFENTPVIKPRGYTIVVKQTFEGDCAEKVVKFDSNNKYLEDSFQNNHRLKTRTNSNMSSDQEFSTPRKHWNKIRNVLKSIHLFSQYEVDTITKPSDIDAHLSSSSKSNTPPREKSPENNPVPYDCKPSQLMRNLQLEAQQNAARDNMRLIDDFKYRKKFFEAIENGSPQDLIYIDEYLKNDPKRYLIVEESTDRRMNKTDSFGQTPMYCAAKNGNVEVLKLLTKYKANHNLLSHLNNDQSASDNPLNVAARWNHVTVLEYLLKSYQWDQKIIKDAIKSTTNKNVKKILSSKVS